MADMLIRKQNMKTKFLLARSSSYAIAARFVYIPMTIFVLQGQWYHLAFQ